MKQVVKKLLFLCLLILGAGCSRSNNSNYYATDDPDIYRIDYSFEKVIHSSIPVKIGCTESPLTLNPYRAASDSEQFISRAVFSTLFNFNGSTKKIEHNLIHDYSISKDLRLYNFFLIEGLKFSDSSPLTAADVVASLKLMEGVLKGSVYYRDFYLDDNRIIFKEIKNDQFTIQLEKPNANLLYLLTDFPIIKEKDAVRLLTIGDFVNFNLMETLSGKSEGDLVVPIGSGPFKISKIEPYSMVLEKNPHYFKNTGGKKNLPATERIVLHYYNSSKDLLNEFIQGNLDLVPLEQSHLQSVKAYLHKDVKSFRIVEAGYGSQHLMVLYNTHKKEGKPVLADKEGRQAIASILLDIEDGYIEAQDSLFSGKKLKEIPDAEVIKDSNNDLISEDSRGNPLFLTVIAPLENKYLTNLAHQLRQKLEKNYISVKLNLISMEDYLRRLFYTNDYDIALISYSFSPSLSGYYNFFLGDKISFSGIMEHESSFGQVETLLREALSDAPWLTGKYIERLDGIMAETGQFYPAYRVKYYYLANNGLFNLKINQEYCDFIDINTIEHIIKLEE